MTRRVSDNEIELSAPQTITVGASDVEALPTRLGRSPRTFFSIVVLTAGTFVTVCFGDAPAIANKGTVITTNQPYIEITTQDSPAFQGAVHLIGSGAGISVAINERFET